MAAATIAILIGSVVFAFLSRPTPAHTAATGILSPNADGIIRLDFSTTHLCDDFGWPVGVGTNDKSTGPCRIISRLPGGRTVDFTVQSAKISRTHDMMSGILMWLPPQSKIDAYVRAKMLLKDWSLDGSTKLDAWYGLTGRDERRSNRISFDGNAPGYGYAVQVVPSYSSDPSKPWAVTFSFGFFNMYTPYEGNPAKTEHDKPLQNLHWDLRASHTTADVGWPSSVKEDFWPIERPTYLVADLPGNHRVDITGWDVHVARQGDRILGFMIGLPEADDAKVVTQVDKLMDQWGILGKEQIQAWYNTPARQRIIDVLQDTYFLRRFDGFQCGTGIELSGNPYRAIFSVSFR